MTGHGESQCQQGGMAIAVEVRTINNRYFKLSVRMNEGYGALESPLEAVVRQHVRRGTVQVNVRVDREPSPDDYKLNEVVLASYRRQLQSLYDHLHVAESIHLESLLSLPGVIDERAARKLDAEADWPLIEKTLIAALESLAQMRVDEGRAMAADLKANCQTVSDELLAIERRAPLVVEAYRSRVSERLNNLLAQYQVSIEASDVIREVALFGERSDISEEIVRLRSHLEQFDKIAEQEESSGRKLDFLTQEMFRETNTIGSKANDAEIARHVIEIKAAIERMREMIQNVE
jgi:uncharacterized protein (TIGR00255 family)